MKRALFKIDIDDIGLEVRGNRSVLVVIGKALMQYPEVKKCEMVIEGDDKPPLIYERKVKPATEKGD